MAYGYKRSGVGDAQSGLLGGLERLAIELGASGATGLEGMKQLFRAYLSTHETSDPQVKQRLRQAMYQIAEAHTSAVQRHAKAHNESTAAMVELLRNLDQDLEDLSCRSSIERLVVLQLSADRTRFAGTFDYQVRVRAKDKDKRDDDGEPSFPTFATFYQPGDDPCEVSIPLRFEVQAADDPPPPPTNEQPELRRGQGRAAACEPKPEPKTLTKLRTRSVQVLADRALVMALTTAPRYRARLDIPLKSGPTVLLTLELLTGK